MIGLLKQKHYANNGLQTFEANTVPYLLKQDNFKPVDYEVELCNILKRFWNIRKLQNKLERLDNKGFNKFFIPAQNRLRFNPEKIDAQVIPYVHDILPYTSDYRENRNRLLRPFIDAAKNKLNVNYVNHLSKTNYAIAASEVTRNDLRTRTSFTGEIDVIYQGIDDMPEPGENTLEESRDIDLLYVGELFERKNPAFVRKTLGKLDKKGYQVAWVNLYDNDLPGESFVNISDEKLAEIYSRSKFILHSSFMEGFGRCPVEAQRYGCIPLALDIPINREILGEKDVAWKPVTDTEDVIELVERFESREMRIQTQRNSERFKWSETRKQLEQVLKQ